MQYDVSTPAEYLDALEDDWRKARILELRDLIARIAPDWHEGIQYQMLNYADARGSVLHLNAQKRYVGVYVGDIGRIDPSGTLLAGLDLGKGCIRLKKSNTLDKVNLRAFLEKLVTLRAGGVDLGC